MACRMATYPLQRILRLLEAMSNVCGIPNRIYLTEGTYSERYDKLSFFFLLNNFRIVHAVFYRTLEFYEVCLIIRYCKNVFLYSYLLQSLTKVDEYIDSCY